MSKAQASKVSGHFNKHPGAVLAGLLFLLIGLFIFSQSSLSYILPRTMGIDTQGIIEHLIETKMDYFKFGDVQCFVDYSFVLPSGKMIQGKTQLTQNDWASLHVGQNVTVQYFAHYPQFNYLVEYHFWGIITIVSIVFPIVLCGLGLFALLHGLHTKKPHSSIHKDNI
jgi:hypothetical protein